MLGRSEFYLRRAHPTWGRKSCLDWSSEPAALAIWFGKQGAVIIPRKMYNFTVEVVEVRENVEVRNTV